MNNYFVIGNPISHSLSPLIHNHWFRKYTVDSNYERRKLNEDDLKGFIEEVRRAPQINGANVTVPFKKKIIPFLDELTEISQRTLSVNTIYKEKGKLIGHNTDAMAFGQTLVDLKFLRDEKDIAITDQPLRSLIIGAGGVTSSVIWAMGNLNSNKESTSYIMNRTKKNAENLIYNGMTENYSKSKVLDWGDIPKNLDIIINTTSIGLTKDEKLKLDFSSYNGLKNTLFYDLIYNPKETNFLADAKKRGNKVMNGKMMFILQAKLAFYYWTKIDAEIDDELINLLND
tara:strand:+ start:242 stop:1099 length:858 start_codon:yes stop_codon:yes gene_type:complete